MPSLVLKFIKRGVLRQYVEVKVNKVIQKPLIMIFRTENISHPHLDHSLAHQTSLNSQNPSSVNLYNQRVFVQTIQDL